jgi:hypothetical protein
VLRRIFGPKRDEVIRGWRTLHTEELHKLYCSPSVLFAKCNYNYEVEEDEMGRACSTNGEKRNSYRILVEKPEGKRPLGRARRRWEDNIRMDIREIKWGGMDLVGLSQDRDQWRARVNTVMNLWVPQNVGKFLCSCATGGLSRRTRLHGVMLYYIGI